MVYEPIWKFENFGEPSWKLFNPVCTWQSNKKGSFFLLLLIASAHHHVLQDNDLGHNSMYLHLRAAGMSKNLVGTSLSGHLPPPSDLNRVLNLWKNCGHKNTFLLPDIKFELFNVLCT